jgi:hypothetical protein
MKQLILGIAVALAFHVGNVEAWQWVPLDQVYSKGRQLIRTNDGPEEGRIVCTSTTKGNDQGIHQDGRRLGYLTERGCKTIGGGNKQVIWFSREDGDIKVLVDDEPAVQEDTQDEGEDYQAMYEAASDTLALMHQQFEVVRTKLHIIRGDLYQLIFSSPGGQDYKY